MSALPEWTKHLFVGDREDYELDGALLAKAACISAPGPAFPSADFCVGVVFAQKQGAHLGIARLFAAAPDLLAALKQAEAMLVAQENALRGFGVHGDEGGPDSEPAINAARAAIAKAKGGASTDTEQKPHPEFERGVEAMREQALSACSKVMDLVGNNRPALDAAERCYVAIRDLLDAKGGAR